MRVVALAVFLIIPSPQLYVTAVGFVAGAALAPVLPGVGIFFRDQSFWIRGIVGMALIIFILIQLDAASHRPQEPGETGRVRSQR